ncbi:GTPase domain-containing protein [Quadrisphaera sp. DSM 44207]|uniref:GTPase domain-containing protein n=1 Tax=Quadrisphaera sp. DSM 44207 TaxID=1881057 RepID=UPI001C408EAF|nr:GTPase domain-containing protein [Quadrisphaera sp. DSM 44207]
MSSPAREDGPASAGGPVSLLDALETLRARVDALSLPLETGGVEASRRERTRLLGQLDDYLIPRLRRLDAPLLAVVGGSTGAGKSTLVNSLVRHHVTTPGVLRPTTRQPVLVHHPDDTAWFTSPQVLPHLPRLTGAVPPDERDDARSQGWRDGDARANGSANGTTSTTATATAAVAATPIGSARGLLLVPDFAQTPGLALLDAPDVDSVVEANRDLAVQLLGAADLWLFVTTAARYADAVPWEVLRTATERGTAVAVVLDRVPPDAVEEVREDLARMLQEAGLEHAPLFTLVESALDGGMLPEEQLAPLRAWLAQIAADARSRDVVVRRTLSGALASLQVRVPRLADSADAQDAEVEALRADLEEAYAGATDGLSDHLSDGTLLRGEVLARWQEFVGTGELLRSLQGAVGRVRDRVVAAVRRRPPPAERLGEALAGGVAALVVDAAARGREQALLRWRARPSGAALLAHLPPQRAGLADPRLPARTGEDVERLVRDWQGHVLDLVRAEGQGRRSQALLLSLGVSGAGAVLMLVVFAGSAGLTGAEAGIAAATAALAQRVLEAVFGDQAVRELAEAARKDLVRRVEDLLAGQRAELAALLPPSTGDGPRLRDVARTVAGASAAEQDAAEQDGAEQDGAEQDGAEQDGAEQDGAAGQDGAEA